METSLNISAWDINPTDSTLTKDLFRFIDECFKTCELVNLEETGKTYTSEQREELANDIVTIHEHGKNA